MSRKKRKNKVHFVKPDYIYNSEKVAKFINYIMKDGKKVMAQNIVYRAFDMIKEKIEEKSPLEVFEQAVINVTPELELRSRRIGGNNYQIPFKLTFKKQQVLAFKWIINGAKQNKAHTFYKCLANSLIDSYNKVGKAIEKKASVYKMAEANKAFIHYRW